MMQPRWTKDQAWQWHERQPWICGVNFVPSTACNTTEWWEPSVYDRETSQRELGWARAAGFNSIRVFIQYLVWKHDPDGLKSRVDTLLSIARANGLTVMPVLFDDCTFGSPKQTEPYLGRQRDPIPAMILPSWTPSPGHRYIDDPDEWPSLKAYVIDMVGAFASDERIVAWDLYNEPGNEQTGERSLPLLEASFDWARIAKPTQPLTTGIWNSEAEFEPINNVMAEISDVISFHAYTDKNGLKATIEKHRRHERPLICTEWMCRHLGSRYETDLPVFRTEGVACYAWGLVNGRTQAHYAWWDKPGDEIDPNRVWFSDILHKDGSAYDPAEIAAIQAITRGESTGPASAHEAAPRRPASGRPIDLAAAGEKTAK